MRPPVDPSAGAGTALIPVPASEAHLEAGLPDLEVALGHRFLQRELLLRALTHRSLANQQAADEPTPASEFPVPTASTADNERLEFLGDAVLGLAVAQELFQVHPDWHEGELTRVRATLVSRKHMAEVAADLDLGRFVRLSRGEDRSGLRSKSTVLSNTMEAVLGALYLDAGLDAVLRFVRARVMGQAAEKLAQELRSGAALGNFKSALQEFLQSSRAGTPLYRVKAESGPDHRKRFVVEVRVKAPDGQLGEPLANGHGTTKKLAEQDAARRAFERCHDAANTAVGLAAAQPNGKPNQERKRK